jgi:hypothetical protein
VTRKRCHFSASPATWHSQLSYCRQQKKQAEIGNLQARDFPVSSCWLMLADAGRLCASLALPRAEVPRKRLWRRRESSLGRVSPLRSGKSDVVGRCVAHASAKDQRAKVLRADDSSGSKTALANPHLTLQLAHVLSSPPSLHIPTENRLLYPHRATNASPVHLRRLLSR